MNCRYKKYCGPIPVGFSGISTGLVISFSYAGYRDDPVLKDHIGFKNRSTLICLN